MWTIIIPLAAGYLLSALRPGRAARLPVSTMINISLVLLLLVMGARIGADPEVIGEIGRIGLQGLVFALATVAGSIIPLLALQRWLKPKAGGNGVEAVAKGGGTAWSLTLLLAGSVLAGVIIGLLLLPENLLPALIQATTWVLGLLLLGIGLDLGRSTRAFIGL